MKTYMLICPHCQSKARVGKSTQVTPTYKELRCTCANDECGYVWVACITPVRTLSPSAVPDPDVAIPLSPHIRRENALPCTEDNKR
ncbi:ogr/Delta-like zinc finger family protein [Guyparkeria sp. GHLCS8-2]|uniref:ogr/Delta-like zinc finger family protein n=1 Tax=Guyparkeria halopsychrophila TaxID=3139421 RepID=UPI0037C60E1D